MSRIDEESMEISKYSHKSHNRVFKQRPQALQIVNCKEGNSKKMHIFKENSLDEEISQGQDRDENSHFSQEKARIVDSDSIEKYDREKTFSNNNQIPKEFLDEELREYQEKR